MHGDVVTPVPVRGRQRRQQIIAEARLWLGVPWRHQGRTRAGVDCAGLVVMVARALGLADYDVRGYSRRASGFDFVRHFQAAMAAVRVAEARPGDVLVFARLSGILCKGGFHQAKLKRSSNRMAN